MILQILLAENFDLEGKKFKENLNNRGIILNNFREKD